MKSALDLLSKKSSEGEISATSILDKKPEEKVVLAIDLLQSRKPKEEVVEIKERESVPYDPFAEKGSALPAMFGMSPFPLAQEVKQYGEHSGIELDKIEPRVTELESKFKEGQTYFADTNKVLDETGAKLKEDTKRLNLLKNKIDKFNLDTTSSASVEAYGRLASEFNTLLGSVKERSDAYNRTSTEYNQLANEYKERISEYDNLRKDLYKIKNPEKSIFASTLDALWRVPAAVGGSLAILPGAGVAAGIEAIPKLSTDPELEWESYTEDSAFWNLPATEEVLRRKKQFAPSSGFEGAKKTFEEVMSVPMSLIQTKEEAEAVDNLMLAMKPIEMSGEGWRLIGEGIESELKELGLDASYIEPILATMGESAAIFATPAIIRRGPARVRATYEKVVREAIRESAKVTGPKQVIISAQQLREFHGLGRSDILPPEIDTLLKELGLKGKDYRAALKNGIDVTIPLEEVMIFRDRPWFAGIKKLFGADPYERVVSMGFKGEKPTWRPISPEEYAEMKNYTKAKHNEAKAKAAKQKSDAADAEPNEAIKNAQKRMAEVEARQAELEAEAIRKKALKIEAKKKADEAKAAKASKEQEQKAVEDEEQPDRLIDEQSGEEIDPEEGTKIAEESAETELEELKKEAADEISEVYKKMPYEELKKQADYGVGAAKKELARREAIENAEGLREDEGQVSEGRDAEEGGTEESSKDLELEAQRQLSEEKTLDLGKVPYTQVKPEMIEVFNFMDDTVPSQNKGALKRKKKFTVYEKVLKPGEPAKVPATWHDGTYRYSVLKYPDGHLELGASGSYDTVMMEGHAARAGEGVLPPGHTAYLIDLGPGNYRAIRIYRAAGEVTSQKKITEGKKPKPEKQPKLTPEEKKALNRAGYPVKLINKMKPEEGRLKLSIARGEVSGEGIDLGLGADIKLTTDPDTPTTEHPFHDKNREHTERLKQEYARLGDAVLSDPDLMLGKLINDVNRWVYGEELPIDKVRNGLREMYARAEEVRMLFDTPDAYRGWVESVSDASEWASKAKRVKKSEDVQLNVMVPVTELPQMVKDVLKTMKVVTRTSESGYKEFKIVDLYRNIDLWRKTGFWIGKDKKWRYELSPDEVKWYVDKILETPENATRVIFEVLSAPRLFAAIPRIANLKVVRRPLGKDRGVYYDDDKIIAINTSLNKYTAAETLNHELQHAINDIVGSRFVGSSVSIEISKLRSELYARLLEYAKTPELKAEIAKYIKANKPNELAKSMNDLANKTMDKDLHTIVIDYITANPLAQYVWDAGEMESRLASERAKLTAEERKYIPPWDTLEEMLERDARLYGVHLHPKTSFKLYDVTGASIEAAKTVIKRARSITDYMRKARGIKSFKFREATRLAKESAVRELVDMSGNIRQNLLWGFLNVEYPAEVLELRQRAYDILNKYEGQEIPDKAVRAIMKINKKAEQIDKRYKDRVKTVDPDEGYSIVQKMYTTKGASTWAAYLLQQLRKEVYTGISRPLREILDAVILADRMLDIASYKAAGKFVFPNGMTPTDYAAYRETFGLEEVNGHRNLTAAEVDDINNRAKVYFYWMKRPLYDLYLAELISKEDFNNLSKHNYRRISLVEILDNKYEVKIGGKKRTIYDSGVQRLARGKDTDVYEPSSEVMALEVFNRAYGRILNNRANLSLLELARRYNENPFVRVKEAGKRIPKGWQKFYVFEQGKKLPMYLSPEMSREWLSHSSELSYKVSQVLRYTTMSPVLRTFATGINWGFALANLPRDMVHLWWAARVFEDGRWKSLYSPHMPIAAIQEVVDIAKSIPDVIGRKGMYEKYLEYGGGMEFLVHQGRLLQRGRHIGSPMHTLLDVLAYPGETTEMLTRIAITRHVINRRAKQKGISFEDAAKDPDILLEATFAARDYMDHGQGGNLTKAADGGFPYLNTGVQGSRGMFRAFKPGEGTAATSVYKMAQFALLVTMLYLGAKHFNPKTMEDLRGSSAMATNLCIPLGDKLSFVDEFGQTRYIYFKVPLDHAQRFFKTFFEASIDKFMGDEVDVDRVTTALKTSMPVEIDQLPPSVSAVLGYIHNKDFWYNEDIWKKTDPLPWPKSKKEYTPGVTPQMYIDLGSATGLSPERMRYAVGEILAGDNMFTWMVGSAYELLTGQLPEGMEHVHIAKALSKTPVLRRFIGITTPYSKWATKIDDARIDAQHERLIQNLGLDELVRAELIHGTASRDDVVDYMKSFGDIDTYNRLKEDYLFQRYTIKLPNKSFWLGLRRIPTTDGRAKVFAEEFNKASEERKEGIMSEIAYIRKAGGIWSDEFFNKAMKHIGDYRESK